METSQQQHNTAITMNLKRILTLQRQKLIQIIFQSINDKFKRYEQIYNFIGELAEKNQSIPEDDSVEDQLKLLKLMLFFNNNDASNQIDLVLENSAQIQEQKKIIPYPSSNHNSVTSQPKQENKPKIIIPAKIANSTQNNSEKRSVSTEFPNPAVKGALYNQLIGRFIEDHEKKSSQNSAINNNELHEHKNVGNNESCITEESTCNSSPKINISENIDKIPNYLTNTNGQLIETNSKSSTVQQSIVQPPKSRKVVPTVKPSREKQIISQTPQFNLNRIIDISGPSDEVKVRGSNGEILRLIIRPDTNMARNKNLLSRGTFLVNEEEEAKYQKYLKEITEVEETKNVVFTPLFKSRNFFLLRIQNERMPILSVLSKEDMELIIKLTKVIPIQRRVSLLLRLSPRLICSVMLKYKPKYGLGDPEVTQNGYEMDNNSSQMEEEGEEGSQTNESLNKESNNISALWNKVKIEEPFEIDKID